MEGHPDHSSFQGDSGLSEFPLARIAEGIRTITRYSEASPTDARRTDGPYNITRRLAEAHMKRQSVEHYRTLTNQVSITAPLTTKSGPSSGSATPTRCTSWPAPTLTTQTSTQPGQNPQPGQNRVPACL